MNNNVQDTTGVHVNVCDTNFYPANEAFPAFREAVASAFMPWLLEDKSKSDFGARMAGLSTKCGSFGRTRMTPLTGIRNKLEVSNSPEVCLYANYVISGRLIVEQGDKTTTANEGDLIVYDSTLPLKHIKMGDVAFEDLSFSIPKDQIGSAGHIFENIAIPSAKIIAPLLSCFNFFAHNFSSATLDELDAVATACAALLSVASGHSTDQRNEAFGLMTNRRAQEMLRYIDAHIRDIELSPSAAAGHLGISVRYVHKQFAMCGTTFSDYVRSKRLESIRLDLLADAGRRQSIANLAFSWGFNDLSTFARAFKKKFGCAPRDYRSKF
jgi:AraC family transcriptional activator of tynA and feaB